MDLNVSHRGSPSAAVEQEIDDDPIPMLTEVAVGFRLPQKDHKLFVSVNLFDCFGSLVELDVQVRVSFLVTPREGALS